MRNFAKRRAKRVRLDLSPTVSRARTARLTLRGGFRVRLRPASYGVNDEDGRLNDEAVRKRKREEARAKKMEANRKRKKIRQRYRDELSEELEERTAKEYPNSATTALPTSSISESESENPRYHGNQRFVPIGDRDYDNYLGKKENLDAAAKDENMESGRPPHRGGERGGGRRSTVFRTPAVVVNSSSSPAQLPNQRMAGYSGDSLAILERSRPSLNLRSSTSSRSMESLNTTPLRSSKSCGSPLRWSSCPPSSPPFEIPSFSTSDKTDPMPDARCPAHGYTCRCGGKVYVEIIVQGKSKRKAEGRGVHAENEIKRRRRDCPSRRLDTDHRQS